jgi:histidyl-tRNA synthetase
LDDGGGVVCSIEILQFDMVIAPGVVYNIRQYSGMICQFVCDLKKKHRHGNKEVLAAGGRYDSMIASYRKIVQEANPLSKEVPTQSAVGISLSLDKLVQAHDARETRRPGQDGVPGRSRVHSGFETADQREDQGDAHLCSRPRSL